MVGNSKVHLRKCQTHFLAVLIQTVMSCYELYFVHYCVLKQTETFVLQNKVTCPFKEVLCDFSIPGTNLCVQVF